MMNNIKNIDKSISKAIKDRSSIRSYCNKEIEENNILKIKKYINELEGPFKEQVRFKWLNSKEDIKRGKFGTYGVIKGAENYIGVSYKKGDMALEELGYEMEKLILYITSLGLGTCWIGGTFKKSKFAKAMELEEDEFLPIITPIGYPSEKRSFIDSTMRFIAKSKQRKEWSDIFFLKDFSVPLTQYNNLGKFKEVLENVRIAPSALNKQPWRIVKSGSDFHFYIHSDKSVPDGLEFNIHKIDMGIAMCHFDLSCKELGIEGEFRKCDPKINNVPRNTEYVITWSQK